MINHKCFDDKLIRLWFLWPPCVMPIYVLQNRNFCYHTRVVLVVIENGKYFKYLLTFELICLFEIQVVRIRDWLLCICVRIWLCGLKDINKKKNIEIISVNLFNDSHIIFSMLTCLCIQHYNSLCWIIPI